MPVQSVPLVKVLFVSRNFRPLDPVRRPSADQQKQEKDAENISFSNLLVVKPFGENGVQMDPGQHHEHSGLTSTFCTCGRSRK